MPERDISGDHQTPASIIWRESPRFGRFLSPSVGRTRRIALMELGVFSSSAALFLLGRFAFWLIGIAKGQVPPTSMDVIGALIAGWAAALGIPWMFRHSFGHIRIDHRAILVVRLAALPSWTFLGKSWMEADPSEAYKLLSWEEVDGLNVDSMSLGGRRYDVLLVRTKDGRSHPIALDRRVDVEVMFRMANVAGMSWAQGENLGSR